MEDFRGSNPATVAAVMSSNAQTPSVPKLPFGHCLVNPRWRKDSMLPEIQKYFTVVYSDEFEYVDFIPSSSHLVTVLTEEEIKENSEANQNVRRKLARVYKLKDKNHSIPLVVYQLSELTRPCFFKIQTLCVLDFHMAVYPVWLCGCVERIKVAAKVPNPFKADRTGAKYGTGRDQLLVMMGVPGLKETHARKLLGKFGSLRGVMMADQADVSAVVGDRLSRALAAFLDRNNSL